MGSRGNFSCCFQHAKLEGIREAPLQLTYDAVVQFILHGERGGMHLASDQNRVMLLISKSLSRFFA